MELRKWRSHEGDLLWSVNIDGTERVLDATLDDILCSEDPLDYVLATLTSFRLPPGSTLLAPIDKQEIWASGVTYERSRDARMEESKQGGDFYDLVYDADRPELFFKASSWRATGHLGRIRVRKDSSWDVPEPELTLVANNCGHIIGATIGNDVSSRSIEGENPLYLPQVICAAPLLDMVRYEEHGLGPTWADEYGTASDATELSWLLAYSPYHHVREGTDYPATLFTGAFPSAACRRR